MGQHPKKLELSFHKPTKQWRKRHKLKEYYLGAGRGKADVVSYQRALNRWNEIRGQLDKEKTQKRQQDEQNRYDGWRDQLVARPDVDIAQYVGGTAPIMEDDNRKRDFVSEAGRLLRSFGVTATPAQIGVNGKPHVVGTLIKAFLVRREILSSSGQRSLGRYENLRKGLSQFREWVGADANPNVINSRVMADYHTALLMRVARKEMGEACAKARMQTLRQFINWAWENEYIELPRNIRSKDLEVGVSSKPVKAMSIADYQILYGASNSRTRLFLLLMANCGMNQKDISDLTHLEVDWHQGRIIRKRSKTKKHLDVPTVNYKLWPETLELLKTFRGSHAELVLTNKTGQPLVRDYLKSTAERDEPYLVRVNSISYAYERLRKKLKPLPMLPMKFIRKTGATLIARKFPWFPKLYLGHSARSLDEKHYLAQEDARLDEPLAWLREQLIPPQNDTGAPQH